MELVNKQINKFCWYGLLKNLRFFEPYLILYLTTMGLSLLQIGLLYTVREVVIYIFEVPSGVFADYYGKKTELMMSFIFYIISFILFFLGRGISVYLIAYTFFGLGEAFRSGTHKAMIMAYLDKMNIKDSKAKVYGKTRSYSLIGSTLSSVTSIVFILTLKNMSFLFLICILPYLLDFFLIMSYPNFLNEKKEGHFNLREFFEIGKDNIKYTLSNIKILKTTIDSSLYNGMFKTIKDYIQPVLSTVLLVGGMQMALSSEDQIKVSLGIIYACIYALSAIASRYSHIILEKIELDFTIKLLCINFAVLSFLVGLSIKLSLVWLSILAFLLINITSNIRRPMIVQKYSGIIENNKRATVLSVDSQITSLIVAVLAPIMGFIADNFSLSIVFYIISVIMILFTIVNSIKRNSYNY